jgi:hypothetical protein
VRKWDLSVLFDASPKDAERLLIEVADFVRERNATTAVSLTAITDLSEWEKCHCGTTFTRREAVHP